MRELPASLVAIKVLRRYRGERVIAGVECGLLCAFRAARFERIDLVGQ